MLSALLNTFLTVAKCQNFTRAAEVLYTTQPTISRQIRTLEEELGFPLFLREYKKISLTPEGKVMLQACEKMQEIFLQGLQTAREHAMGVSGEIKIGYLSSFDAGKMLFPSLERIDELYPNIKLQMEKASYYTLRKGLQNGLYDVIITLSFEAELLHDVVVKEIERVKCYFVLSERHPLYTKEDLNLSDLVNSRFVLPAPAESPRRAGDLERILQSLGSQGAEIVFEPNMESLMFHVRTGKSIALLNCYENDLFAPFYRRIELPDDQNDLYTVAIWKKNNQNPLIPLLF